MRTSSTAPRLVKPEPVEALERAPETEARSIVFGDDSGRIEFQRGGVRFEGKPVWGSFLDAVGAADYLDENAQFWKADLLEYAHKRADWSGLIDSVIDAGHYTKRAVDQMRYVSRKVPRKDRVVGVSFGHHEAVAPLEPGDKRKYLEQAKIEHLSVGEMKQIIRRDRQVKKVARGQADELAKLFDAVAGSALTAAEYCRAIAREDGAGAEKMIGKARAALDLCEEHVKTLRKAEGR